MTNIAIENGNLYWIYPLKMVWFSIVMLVYQRANILFNHQKLQHSPAELTEFLTGQRLKKLLWLGGTRLGDMNPLALIPSQKFKF